MPQQLPLSKGRHTLVDDADYDHLAVFNWKFSSRGYAFRPVKRPNGLWTYVYLHRQIIDATDRAIHVDHINRDKLDNRRANLRLATRSENQWNKGLAENNTSGYKGVCVLDGKFSAGLKWHGRHIHIAFVDSPILAAQLYDALARLLFKDFARPNFEHSAAPTPELEFYLARALTRLRKSGLNV